MSHKSISPRKLELRQPFAYPSTHELGSFKTNKNHIRRGDSLFGKLKNFLRFVSSLDMSFPVWGKFKLPTAKAAPKFLLAEKKKKKKSLFFPQPPSVQGEHSLGLLLCMESEVHGAGWSPGMGWG